jgi:hypothetical protein
VVSGTTKALAVGDAMSRGGARKFPPPPASSGGLPKSETARAQAGAKGVSGVTGGCVLGSRELVGWYHVRGGPCHW